MVAGVQESLKKLRAQAGSQLDGQLHVILRHRGHTGALEVEGGQELLLHLADIVDGVIDENLDDAAFPRFRQLSRHLGTGNAELGGDFGLGPSLFII